MGVKTTALRIKKIYNLKISNIFFYSHDFRSKVKGMLRTKIQEAKNKMILLINLLESIETRNHKILESRAPEINLKIRSRSYNEVRINNK